MLRGKNLQKTSTIIKFTLFPNMKYFFTPCNLNSITSNTRFFKKIKGILSGHPYLDKLVTGNVSLPSWYSGGVLTALDPELQSPDLTRFCPGLDITGASGVLEQGGGGRPRCAHCWSGCVGGGWQVVRTNINQCNVRERKIDCMLSNALIKT